jgi:hypothetical protein
MIRNIDGQMKKRGRMRTASEGKKRENPCSEPKRFYGILLTLALAFVEEGTRFLRFPPFFAVKIAVLSRFISDSGNR